MELPPRRKTLRLPEYDYAQNGCYFVTVCSHEKKCIFGDVKDGTVCLNPLGVTVEAEWLALETAYPHITVVPFIVMPNHFHAIIGLYPEAQGSSVTIPSILRRFKSQTTILAHRMGYSREHLWQRNYYEHIIRTEQEYQDTTTYIEANPLKWNGEP